MQYIGICMLLMGLTTYIIRVTPIGFVRKKLDNAWIQDFLYYIPYCVLSAMTFPGVIYSTTPTGAAPPHYLSAVIATVVAIALSWKNKGLVLVALVAVIVAIAVELLLLLFPIAF